MLNIKSPTTDHIDETNALEELFSGWHLQQFYQLNFEFPWKTLIAVGLHQVGRARFGNVWYLNKTKSLKSVTMKMWVSGHVVKACSNLEVKPALMSQIKLMPLLRPHY